MKYLIWLFLLISIRARAQQVDILIIGVSHNYSKYPAQDLACIYDKIRKFHPDAFFGEFLSK